MKSGAECKERTSSRLADNRARSTVFYVASAPARPLASAAGNGVDAAVLSAQADGITVSPNALGKKGPEQQATEQKAIEQYWTPERMRNAQPYPDIVVSGDVTAGRSAPTPNGPSGFIPATLPANKADVPGAAEADAAAANGGAANIPQSTAPLAPTGYSYPGPYTRYTIPGSFYTSWPYVTVGKIFFTQLGRNYVCSGVTWNACVWNASLLHAATTAALLS